MDQPMLVCSHKRMSQSTDCFYINGAHKGSCSYAITLLTGNWLFYLEVFGSPNIVFLSGPMTMTQYVYVV